jgi:AraC family transcriptional regulator
MRLTDGLRRDGDDARAAQVDSTFQSLGGGMVTSLLDTPTPDDGPRRGTQRPEATGLEFSSPPSVPRAASLLVQLIEDAIAALDHNRDRTRASLELVSTLLRGEDRPRLDGKRIQPCKLPPWQIDIIIDQIERDHDKALSCRELAQLVGLSKNYFSTAFRRTFGDTPHHYIVRRRVERAQMQMLNSRDALSQIALNCGFADQSHFCRVFRRFVGVPPLAWRRARIETTGEFPTRAPTFIQL